MPLSKRFVEVYGDDATIHADELLERDDLDGTATWRRVLDAVKELETTESRGALYCPHRLQGWAILEGLAPITAVKPD